MPRERNRDDDAQNRTYRNHPPDPRSICCFCGVEMNLHGTLEWPSNILRKKVRKEGLFKADGKYIAVTAAIARLEDELARHGARNAELSAMFGRTRAGNISQTWAGGDPGCCVRYDIGKQAYTLPCDTYSDLGQNIAAIAKHLEAVRAMERYGVATTAQTMGAFASLPAPSSWSQVLGLDPSAPEAVVRSAYRVLARSAHPDVEGGSHDAMARLNAAMESYEKFKQESSR